MKHLALIALFASFGFQGVARQNHSAEILHELNQLQVLGSVLYVAAHPDDENTRLITYFANAKGYKTTYLSLTRGDGGQNLIGKEVREQLGVIRTQELLAARRTDGGSQQFSRANDFGYSKNPDETFNIWDREKVLADAIWAIRLLRPDVIVTRFSPTRGRTHGHHTASAILAVEAFQKANDPNVFPEQLKWVKPWQPKRVVWNTHPWFYRGTDEKFDPSDKIKIDAGGYNPLLGRSYGEIAALSRSQHKCQGFGAALQRGGIEEWLAPLDGPVAKNDLFDEVDTSWKRVKGGKNVQKLIEKAIANFNPQDPSTITPELIAVFKELKKLDPSDYWVKEKTKNLQALILKCNGFWADVTNKESTVVSGDSLQIVVRFINRSAHPITVTSIDLGGNVMPLDSVLTNNRLIESKIPFLLSEKTAFSNPYWLQEKNTLGMYTVNEQTLIGTPENKAALTAKMTLSFPEQAISFVEEYPVSYRWVDPSDGEKYRPLEVVPKVSVGFMEPVVLLAQSDQKTVKVKVQSHRPRVNGALKLELPNGWEASPDSHSFNIEKKGATQEFEFTIKTSLKHDVSELSLFAEINEKRFTQDLVRIEYDHIPTQTLLPEAKARLVKIDIRKKGERIGYIMGAGDVVPEALQSIGYHVDLLEEADFSAANLAGYDAIIAGVRAYNTVDAMKFHQEKLMHYVENGGTYIVQYNTSFRLKTKEVGPYPLELSKDRVTVEEAPVKFLAPDHDLLNFPNQLSEEDFANWVQERGLYFPNKWDEKYTPILEMNDPGEGPTQGSLLVTDYGKGKFIYTGLSFFRELPAGVPGAYRLLANMISIGKKENP